MVAKALNLSGYTSPLITRLVRPWKISDRVFSPLYLRDKCERNSFDPNRRLVGEESS